MADCTCANPQAVASAIDGTTSKVDDVSYTLHGGAHGGPLGAIDALRFCHWAAPEYGNISENNWNVAFKAAALAIALANSIAQGEIAEKQQDLADRYYQMAKYKWERFKDKYMPLEKKLLLEVSTVPVRELNCIDDRDRAEQSVNPAFSTMSDYLSRNAKKLRLCIDPAIISAIELRRAQTLVDTENYNLQDDQFFTDFKNDQRWNRRSTVLNLGRNLSSQALKYGDVARSLYSQVGAQIDQAAGSLMSALGYYGARNDTFYPTTYLGSNGAGSSSSLIGIHAFGGNNPTGLNPTG